MITLNPGDSSFPRVAEADTLCGDFFVGVSEVLGLAWKLENAIKAMVPAARNLLVGTPDSPSLVEQFYDIAYAIDSLSIRLASATTTADNTLGNQMHSLNSALIKTRRTTRTLSAKGSEIIEKANAGVGELTSFVVKVDTLLAKLDDIIGRIESAEGILSDDSFRTITKALGQLRIIVDDMERGVARIRLLISLLRE
jgi:hypothetical protein